MELGRNIYEQQAHNKRQTVFVMLGFVLFLAFIGFGFDYFYLGLFEDGFSLPLGTIIAVIFGSGMALHSYHNGAKSVLQSTGAVPANPGAPAERMLINVVEEMSIASGMPVPQVYIVEDEDPNAFATGRDPEHSYVVVTKGLLKALNREELQAVIAHEMSHIRNFDIRLMTVIAAFVGAIVLLSDAGRRGMRFGGATGRSSRSKNSGSLGLFLMIFWLLGIVLAPLIAQMMAMFVSRKREYLADASGAELTRNPLGLANALQKLERAADPTTSIKRGAAHMCIVDPVGRNINSKEGIRAEIFGTHPPIEKRILALNAMAYQYQTTTSV